MPSKSATTTTEDYPYIRAWGKMMGSYRWYIIEQVELARREQAPQNATHRYSDGTWSTTDDILSWHTRDLLDLPPLGPPAPPTEPLPPRTTA